MALISEKDAEQRHRNAWILRLLAYLPEKNRAEFAQGREGQEYREQLSTETLKTVFDLLAETKRPEDVQDFDALDLYKRLKNLRAEDQRGRRRIPLAR